MKTLFVGGPWDGRKANIDPDREYWMVEVPALGSPLKLKDNKRFEYRRKRLVDSDVPASFSVMTYLPDQSLMKALIDGYKAPQEHNGE